jgi:hypothetical protein
MDSGVRLPHDVKPWGKRDMSDFNDVDKRKWSGFTSWGKRSDLDDVDKRNWSGFTSWGKRSDLKTDHLLPGYNGNTRLPQLAKDDHFRLSIS